MASKNELQNQLKALYGINKNISESLSKAECETLIDRLQNETSFMKLVEAYVEKNTSLGKNNAAIGGARSRAERRSQELQAELKELEGSIEGLESTTQALTQRKQQLELDRVKLSAEIQEIVSQNQGLEQKVTQLNVLTDELTDANDILKKDNKALKNQIDAIRLRLTQEVRHLLNYDNSEIRRALVKFLKSTLG